MFTERISIVHIRQSRKTIWSPSVGQGDLDYKTLSQILQNKGVSPLFVNEQIPSEPAEAYKSMADNYKMSAETIRKWFQL